MFTTRTTSDLSHQLFTLNLRLKENRFDFIDFSFENKDTVFLFLPIFFAKPKLEMNLKQQTQFGAIWLQIENMNFQIELYFVERGSKKKMHPKEKQKQAIFRVTIFL